MEVIASEKNPKAKVDPKERTANTAGANRLVTQKCSLKI
jgi:hypothetical protein